MNGNPHDVCISGLGYIGLPTAVLAADAGLRVFGCDLDWKAIKAVRFGITQLHEPGLDEALQRAHAAGRLQAGNEPVAASVQVIAVPTPFAADKSADLSAVHAAVRAVAPVLRAGDVVILESTSPVGTSARLRALIAQERPDLADPLVAYCPERVLPGRILYEAVHNARIIGGLTPEAGAKAEAFYARFALGERRQTNAHTAEAVKLAENAFRDVNIAFANELDNLGGVLGFNAREVIALANLHPRVNILQPGPGVGGHCIAVDPWFLAAAAPDHAPLIRSARAVNDARPAVIAERVLNAVPHARAHIGCLGLTYKADTDDCRESPAVQVVDWLRRAHPGRVSAHDPYVPESDALTTVLSADVVVILTDHRAVHALRDTLRQGMRDGLIVVDTRGVL